MFISAASISSTSIDRRVRQENASGSSSYPRASFGKRKWMCVCTAPSPIYMRDRISFALCYVAFWRARFALSN